MVKRLVAFLFLTFFLSLSQAEEQVKHHWLPLYSGGFGEASVYVDVLSVKKIGADTWSFIGATATSLGAAVTKFEDNDGNTIALSRPAFTLYYYMQINCATEIFTPSKTDYYDEHGKLILSYKIDPQKAPFPAQPGYDTTLMFQYFCHREPSKRDDA